MHWLSAQEMTKAKPKSEPPRQPSARLVTGTPPKLQDIDMSNHDSSRVDLAGLSQFEWNNYYKGIGRDGYTQGYRGSTHEGRIKDNMVISEGDPVSCAAIGF